MEIEVRGHYWFGSKAPRAVDWCFPMDEHEFVAPGIRFVSSPRHYVGLIPNNWLAVVVIDE